MMKEVDVQAILAQLSTEEKVALLHGTGMGNESLEDG